MTRKTARPDRETATEEKNRFRLLYVANARIPTEKAHGYQILQMSQAFSEAGCEILLLHPKRRTFPADVAEYYGLRREIPRAAIPCIDAIGWLRPEGLVFRLFARAAAETKNISFALTLFFWFLRRGGSRAADAVYTRDIKIALALSVLLPGVRKKLFVECHSLSVAARQQRTQARILSKCAGVICMTGPMRRRLVELGVPGAKLIVEPDAVDLETFTAGIDRGDARRKLDLDAGAVYAVFVGRFHTMEMEKGIPQIIESAKHLFSRHPALKFLFVGGPMDRVRHYETIIRDRGLDRDRFVFVDKQPVADIPAWLAAADVLLMPFPWTEHYAYYASPLKMFEYMASNRPMVASDLPAVTELLENGRNVVLAPPGEPEGLATGIETLLNDETLREKIAAAAYDLVQEYSWSARADRIVGFIEGRAGDAS